VYIYIRIHRKAVSNTESDPPTALKHHRDFVSRTIWIYVKWKAELQQYVWW